MNEREGERAENWVEKRVWGRNVSLPTTRLTDVYVHPHIKREREKIKKERQKKERKRRKKKERKKEEMSYC